jgi:hypothetical protein
MSIQSNFPAIKPTLLLDFASVKALDPRITFARASTGTFYGTQTAKAEENLLLQSQDFDNAVWGATRATISANSTTAPDGTTTADSLTQASGQTVAGLLQVTTNPANIAAAYVFSVFAKPNGKNFIRLTIVDVGAGNVFRECYFNVSTGTVGTANNGAVGTISAVANGFYRCSIAYTFATASTISPRVFLADTDNSATVVDSGGVFLWGAQLEQRSAVTAYTPTTTQPITNYVPQLLTAASGVARFDHNPITDESLGLLIEEQRANLRTYSEDFTNAVWSKSASSITADTVVAPDGTLTGDKLVENTATSRHFVTTTLTLTANTVYTLSVYMKAGERTTATLGNSSTANWVATSSIVVNLATGVITSGTGTIQSVGNGWYRVSITQTFGPANANGGMIIDLQTTAGYTGNGFSGVFLWGAQLEVGAFPTSYIPTVASQVTRAADAASMTGANFSSWFSNAEGTLYAELNPLALAASSGVVINDNTTSNRIRLATTSVSDQGTVTTSGTAQAVLDGGTPAANTSMKLAMTYQVNNFALSLNGATAATDTTGTVPVVSQLQIGSETTTVGNLRIKKMAYYPIVSTATQLQALTS